MESPKTQVYNNRLNQREGKSMEGLFRGGLMQYRLCFQRMIQKQA